MITFPFSDHGNVNREIRDTSKINLCFLFCICKRVDTIAWDSLLGSCKVGSLPLRESKRDDHDTRPFRGRRLLFLKGRISAGKIKASSMFILTSCRLLNSGFMVLGASTVLETENVCLGINHPQRALSFRQASLP